MLHYFGVGGWVGRRVHEVRPGGGSGTVSIKSNRRARTVKEGRNKGGREILVRVEEFGSVAHALGPHTHTHVRARVSLHASEKNVPIQEAMNEGRKEERKKSVEEMENIAHTLAPPTHTYVHGAACHYRRRANVRCNGEEGLKRWKHPTEKQQVWETYIRESSCRLPRVLGCVRVWIEPGCEQHTVQPAGNLKRVRASPHGNWYTRVRAVRRAVALLPYTGVRSISAKIRTAVKENGQSHHT